MRALSDVDQAHADVCLKVLDDLFSEAPQPPVQVRLWNGIVWPQNQCGEAKATIVFNSPGAFREIFTSADEVRAAEEFLRGGYDILGDVEAVVGVAASLQENRPSLIKTVDVARKLWSLPREKSRQSTLRAADGLEGERHSISRDSRAVTFHYDLSNDFYRLWLDKRLVYSCAYFENEGNSLDEAQERKLDFICRKLRLKPGELLLDIGCGWGGLITYAAKHYGVQALGITLSNRQAEYATEIIDREGLKDCCRVEIRDYREVADQEFDKLVSVGMVEHVGNANLPIYFKNAWKLLKPGGVFLNHGIAIAKSCNVANKNSFINKYVFPDGELAPIHLMLNAAEGAGFEVRDVENLREHYTLTLRHWVRRLEAQHEEALKYVDESVFRIWRLYMSASAYGFACGNLNLFQTLLVKKHPDGSSGLPLTRQDWYK